VAVSHRPPKLPIFVSVARRRRGLGGSRLLRFVRARPPREAGDRAR
jgi:hypothetical protein